MTLIFDELAPPLWIYVSKNALNHFLVNAKDSFRRAKNVVFLLFCILVDMLLPGRIYIALGPWYFGDFRNIFLPNVCEDHKKS